MKYKPRYFELYELVQPELYTDEAWLVFDERILYTADAIRQRFGRMLANTWYWGGETRERGFRLFGTDTGARFSQHKCGRAVDLVPLEASVEDIRVDILENPWARPYKFITAVEMKISWLHVDVRNWDKVNRGILTIYPR